MKKPKNILITGASGFVGANLARRLVKSRDKIHIIIRKNSNLWRLKDILPKLKIHYADLLDIKKVEAVVKKIKPEVIYHLATFSNYLAESKELLKTDIFGVLNLLNACQKTGFEIFINTGSSSEYGAKTKPTKESDILEPNSYYAAAKSCQTLLCQHLAWDKKLPIITLRLFSVYGPYEMPRLIPTLIKNCLNNRDLNLASPRTNRDFVFVEDAVSAYLKAAQKPKLAGQIFNIGSGEQSTLKNVVENIVKLTNSKAKQNWNVYPSRDFDTNIWVADISKAKKLLNWRPRHNLEQGLKKTINWFKKNQYLYEQ